MSIATAVLDLARAGRARAHSLTRARSASSASSSSSVRYWTLSEKLQGQRDRLRESIEDEFSSILPIR